MPSKLIITLAAVLVCAGCAPDREAARAQYFAQRQAEERAREEAGAARRHAEEQARQDALAANERAAAEERARRVIQDQREQEQREADQRATAEQKLVAARVEKERGYKRMSLGDFLVDWRDMPTGTHVSVTALHTFAGSVSVLSTGVLGNPIVVLLTDGLPRQSRKMLLDCHAYNTWCRIRIRGRTGCAATRDGIPSGEACLIAESVADNDEPSPYAPARVHYDLPDGRRNP